MAALTPVASLPMYDLAGFEAETDRLWSAIRTELQAEGLDAPSMLDRGLSAEAAWTHPDLCLSQTCGLPLVTGLAGTATVLGAFDFGLPGCGAGEYNSVLIARALPDPDAPMNFAFNERCSQSGYAAPKRYLGARFVAACETGAHIVSIRAVADGAAEAAAIDAVTWRLAQSVEPKAHGLTVFGSTPSTPGLPLITAPDRDPAPYRRALSRAAAHHAQDSGPLGLRGFVPFDLADYQRAIFPVD